MKYLYPTGRRGRPRISDMVIEEVRKLRKEGKSYAWISWRYQISPTTCREYCVGKWAKYKIKKSLDLE